MIPETVLQWCRLACERVVVIRALKYMVIVGGVLVGINHGDAILAGDVDGGRLLRIGFTVLVPYCVSALSSVGALRQLQRANGPSSPRPPLRSSTPRSP